MTKLKFYKEYHYIKHCRVCGVQYRPGRYDSRRNISLCWPHRKIYLREQFNKWFNNLPEERKVLRKEYCYSIWKKWVIQNIEKRRTVALVSYHKRKNESKNKARKHVRTKPIIESPSVPRDRK